MKLKRNCKQCDEEFLADTRELNRGNAKFCSISCGVQHSNLHRKLHNKVCKHCSNRFESINITAKYCSNFCKQKNYRLRAKSDNKHDAKLKKLIRQYPCENCNYSTTHRDVHHVIHVKDGGKNEYSNLISLCPNCHREAHCDILSKETLFNIIKNRILSLSLKELLKEI